MRVLCKITLFGTEKMKKITPDILLFKKDLKSCDIRDVFRKYIVTDKCYALTDDQQMRLRTEISNHFNIEYNNIIIAVL